MTSKKSITVTIGVVVVVVAAIVAAAAMFLVDQGEETAHLYSALRAKSSNDRNGYMQTAGNAVELRGQWLGISVANLDAVSAQQLGLADVDRGAAVVAVDPVTGARAREAGIQVGDVVVGVDNQPVRDLAELYQKSTKLAADAPVLVDVQRQGQIVTLVVAPPEPNFGIQAAYGPQLYCPRDGILVPQAGSGQVPATCPRCNGPLHMYHPGPGYGRGNGGRWRMP